MPNPPKPAAVVPIQLQPASERLLEALDELLELAKEGVITNFAFVASMTEGRVCSRSYRDQYRSSTTELIGEIEMMKSDLMHQLHMVQEG